MFETISIVLRQAFASMTLGDHPFAKALKWEREIHVRENIKQPFLSFFFFFLYADMAGAGDEIVYSISRT